MYNYQVMAVVSVWFSMDTSFKFYTTTENRSYNLISFVMMWIYAEDVIK